MDYLCSLIYFRSTFIFFERKIITFKIQKLKSNYNSDFQDHFIFKTAQGMVSCCPTLPRVLVPLLEAKEHSEGTNE